MNDIRIARSDLHKPGYFYSQTRDEAVVDDRHEGLTRNEPTFEHLTIKNYKIQWETYAR
jgi:hypothetical protein